VLLLLLLLLLLLSWWLPPAVASAEDVDVAAAAVACVSPDVQVHCAFEEGGLIRNGCICVEGHWLTQLRAATNVLQATVTSCYALQ
jgi:hypothetical protein